MKKSDRLRRLLKHLQATRLLHDFTKDTRGVAIVEFAITLNIVIILYLGTVDLAMMFLARERLEMLTQNLMAMIAQTPTKVIDTIHIGAYGFYAPYIMGETLNGNNTLFIRVTDIMPVRSSSGQPWSMAVCWSRSSDPGQYPTYEIGQHLDNTVIDASWTPTTLSPTASTALILIEVRFTYAPLTSFILGSQIFNQKLIAPPVTIVSQQINLRLSDLSSAELAAQSLILDANNATACNQ